MSIHRASCFAAAFGFLLAACGGGGTEPPQTRTLAKLAGDNQQASAGLTVPTPPSVKVTDQDNRGVAGVAVTFAVATGGGSITGANATTGSDGVATVGSWTLGTTAGSNTLTASANGVTGSPVTFTVTGAPGAAKTVSKQPNTDNQNANSGEAVAVKPAVKVVDQFGNPVPGVSVTFTVASGGGTVSAGTATTDANGVATVGDWFVGAAAGTNTLTATVTGSGITGNPLTFTATSVLVAFNPASNTSLTGNKNYSSVNIPAGVTVTMTGDVSLTVAGAVTIAGALNGDCRQLTIIANGVLTFTGTLSNECDTPNADPPAVTLVGKGGYHLNGATMTVMGDFWVTNDQTLPTSGPGGIGAMRVAPSVSLTSYDCEANGLTWNAPVNPALDGANGTPNGSPGRPGKKWTMGCSGNGLINNSSVTGATGGRGGNGTHTSSVAAVSSGGAGAAGGAMLVHVTGQLDFAGTNTIGGGAGGAGGNANATSTTNGALGAAPPATATGGRGGDGATVTIRGLGGMTVSGVLNLSVGTGGKGGDATAVAADGVNATATTPAQPGGAGTANGGDGGNSPALTATAQGNIGGVGNVNVTGGNGGPSGFADAKGGKGGDGTIPLIDGAIGGAINAVPGRGGNALVRNLQGNLVGTGGASADAFFRNGTGGNGYSDCVPTPIHAGGNGGKGGPASGGGRLGGTGLANGANGVTREITNSNGGNGGHGLGAGARGNAGDNNIVAFGGVQQTPPVFTPGTPGRGCRFTVALTVANDPSPQHEPFVQYTSVNVLDATLVGNIITIVGPAGSKWIAVSGPANVDGQGNITFVANGSGTAAGIPNVPATFTGTISANGQISGVVTLFGSANTPPGGLPGHSVSYNVAGSVSGVTP